MSLIGLLGRGFGPVEVTGGGGGVTLDEPTLAVVDNGDEETATATIGGSTSGTTNTVKTQRLGESSWSSAGSRSGDGTVVLTLSPGAYWIVVDSTKLGASVSSNVAYLVIHAAASSRLADIADLVVEWINDPARVWPIDFSAERVWAGRADLRDIDTDATGENALLVEVVPLRMDPEELLTRGLTEFDNAVLIGIRERYGEGGGNVPNAWIDERAALTERIAEEIDDADLGETLEVQSATIDEVADYAWLVGQQTYFGLITVIVREERAA